MAHPRHIDHRRYASYFNTVHHCYLPLLARSPPDSDKPKLAFKLTLTQAISVPGFEPNEYFAEVLLSSDSIVWSNKESLKYTSLNL
jgi:hypothetical protein